MIRVAREGAVGIVTLDRPEALNALNKPLMEGLLGALEGFERDDSIRCIVLTGSARAFAAGADIKEMEDLSDPEKALAAHLARWDQVARLQTPIIAAVSGFALGGGCELALACDLIVASESAVFGQPEILIGVIPGAGGTQRLARAIGPRRALEMTLTGRRLSAREAFEAGLVCRVAPVESYLDEAKKLARAVASQPPLAARAAKAAARAAAELPLSEGLARERALFYSLFATQDQKEGMKAFVEKRPAVFQGR